MYESTLIQLKTIVERAVRPVRASTSRKKKMREELLAHVCGVYDEESAKLVNNQTALERTALRFGNPAEMTSQLQDTVPAMDSISRYWEARPEDSMLRGALRFAWLEGAICLVVFVAVVFMAGWQRTWSFDELLLLFSGFAFFPLWLFLITALLLGVVLVAHCMENSHQGPEPLLGWPRIGARKWFTSAWAVPAVRTALIVGGLSLFICVGITRAYSPTPPFEWPPSTLALATVPFAGVMASFAVLCAWFLVQNVAERRRYHQEWSSLPI